MKFCSVGAVKYKKERAACDSIQYLFDKNTPKPTDAQSFMNIIPDARSITVDVNDKNLTCSALAGFSGNKLYLASILVAGNRGIDNNSSAQGVTEGAAASNLFYKFGCVRTLQAGTTTSLTTGSASFLDGEVVKLDQAPKFSPLAFYGKTGNTYGYKLMLYPNRLSTATKTLLTKMGYSMSSAQTLSSFSSSSYEWYDSSSYAWRTSSRVTQYITYIGTVRFDVATNKVYGWGMQNSSIPTGNQWLNFSGMSSPGIQLVRPSKNYIYYDTRYGGTTSYWQDQPQIASSPVPTISELTNAPYIELAGTDETVELGFSVIGYRDLDKDNIVIRDFVTDLTQSGNKSPGLYPTVTLNTPLASVQTILDM